MYCEWCCVMTCGCVTGFTFGRKGMNKARAPWLVRWDVAIWLVKITCLYARRLLSCARTRSDRYQVGLEKRQPTPSGYNKECRFILLSTKPEHAMFLTASPDDVPEFRIENLCKITFFQDAASTSSRLGYYDSIYQAFTPTSIMAPCLILIIPRMKL